MPKPVLLFFFLMVVCTTQMVAQTTLLSPDTLFQQATRAADPDEAFELFEQAAKGYQAQHNIERQAECWDKQAYLFYKKRDYQGGADFIREKMDAPEAKPAQQLETFGQFINLRGYYLKKLGRYYEAKTSFEDVLQLQMASAPSSKPVIYALKEIAQIDLRMLDYEGMESVLRLAERQDTAGYYTFSILNSYLIATYYQGKFQQAQQYYQKLRELNLSPRENNQVHYTAMDLMLELEAWDEAEQLALDFLEYNEGYPEDQAEAFPVLARLSMEKGDEKAAQAHYQKGIELMETNPEEKSRTKAKYLAEAGDFFLQLEDLPTALSLYQKALIQVFPNFNDPNIDANPSVEEVFTESWMMSAALKKGRALMQRYRLQQNQQDLETAVACFDLFWAAVDELRRSYGSDGSKFLLAEYLADGVEASVDAQFEYYRQTEDPVALERMYAYMERYKAVALTDAIVQNKTSAFGSIPEDRLQAERLLRSQLSEIKTDLPAQPDLQQTFDSLSQQYVLLLNQLESDFPEFRQFQANLRLYPLQALQEKVKASKTIVIEYFWGVNEVYALKIGGEQMAAYRIGLRDELEKTVNDFRWFFGERSRIETNPGGYASVAHQLYEYLVAPLELAAGRSLLIVPDGPLHQVPFDALMQSASYADLSFLVRVHPIRYAFSSSAVFRQQETAVSLGRRTKKAGFAPLFQEHDRGLAPLMGGITELEALQTLPGVAGTWEGSVAKQSVFVEQAMACALLHLSTHAWYNDSIQQPQIEFIDGAVTLADLYSLQMPGSLVVLSACETNVGTYQQGEGVMSLARGFFYAGASGLLSSLWSVNEGATSVLLSDFYRQFKKGVSASECLQKVKVRYLEAEGVPLARKSPYYWSGLIYVGQEVQMKPFSWQPLLLLLGGIVLVVLFLRARGKRS
jgi:CHAT domain-containing protein